MRNVYMDYAATTYVKPEVLEEMLPYFTQQFGNPSSFYGISRTTKMAIDESREKVAKALNCDVSEVYFTGGGSEADNWAIKGIASAHKNKGNHIITTKVEHHAVLHTCQYLEKLGFEVTYLDVDEEGFINLEDLKNAITDKTILVSIMFANNEIGTIQPIKEIGEICKEKNIYFHTDAVQAIGNAQIDVKEMNIDMLSLAGHKIYGPKGIGVLYIKKGIRIDNLIHGGGQERGRRAGTENIASIVGIGKAIELATTNLEQHIKKMSELRDRLIDGLLKIPYAYLNGPRGDKRLPSNVNVRFRFIEGESILLSLDFEGICASSGSACTSGSLDPSHVLLAIGLPHEEAHGSLRLTLGDGSTVEDVDYVIETLPPIIERLRNMSPLWEDFLKKGEN
ncbi:cysteine desulfurase NifS [Clostridium taeniosporum]|uniref:Cysteine desulfurase IscS n=1 Tax=Clostridium taeniosporum TaxID=394958 RepID=A0A1D7XIN3_9CLOT|nr:cysteine desulfurase NifS [Clostridium taeniosporum]AOR23182.1 cysteine desulfurase NifS [Clostridium taeniosporum]